MELLPPANPLDLDFVVLTTTGLSRYARTNHTVRPAWHYWQVMFTLEGEGEGEIEGRSIRARPGTIWLLPKARAHWYQRPPGRRDTWVYRWLEFDGAGGPGLIRALGFDREPEVHDCLTLQSRLAEIIAALDDGAPLPRQRATALMIQLLTEAAARRAPREDGDGGGDRLVSRARRLLAERLGDELTVGAVAARLGITPAHLIRRFTAEQGISPMRWRTRLRVNQAQRLLAASERSIGEVGAAVGYPRIQHFSRMFTREVGLSPRAYLRGIGRSSG